MDIAFFVGAGAVLVAYVVRKRIANSFGSHDTKDEMKLTGKVVIITGGNTGLGKETAFELLDRGAKVILACRDMERGNKAMDEIRERTNNGIIACMEVDLASFESIRKFTDVMNKRFDQIDILINNAGVFVPLSKRMKTEQGFEINFGVNHIGHFLLTNLLLETMKKADHARIVNVASMLSEQGELNFDDLNMDLVDPESVKSPRGKTPYANSKLANILFSKHLGLITSGTGVHSYALCPGWVKTDLGRNMDFTWWNKILMLPFAFFLMRNVHQGVQTILHCALSKECGTETGKVYRNCDIWQTKCKVTEPLAKKLWEISEKLVKDFDEESE